MIHTIGKLAICFLQIFFCTLHATSVVMELADNQGKKIDHVLVGVPFQLKVIIKGQNTTGVIPRVTYPEDFICKRSGIQMHSVNGASTTIYIYTATVSVAKKYTVGPAAISINGAVVESEPIVFDALVHTHKNASSAQSFSQASEQPFMECVFDKTAVFVGEVVSCRLRFYCPSDVQRVVLKKIQAPQLNYGVIMQKGTQKEGVELIKQKPFKYVEWEFDAQFLKEETMVIPPFVGEYTIEDEEDNMLFGGFSMFFHHNRVSRIQTDSIEINVKPVPTYQGKAVIAVGQFTDFVAAINPTAINVNDAAIFSLRLTGVGNFSMINHMPLQRIDRSIKIYESQSKIESRAHDGEQTKLFDYIIQVSEPGAFKIPSQELVFFDPIKEKHFVMHTNPLTLTVQPSHQNLSMHEKNALQEKPEPKQDVESPSLINDSAGDVVMNPIEYEGARPWLINFTYQHGLLWVILLLFAVLGYYIIAVTGTMVYAHMQYRCAYIHALLALKKLEKHNNVAQIINVFKKYISARCFNDLAYEDKGVVFLIVNKIKDKKIIDEWSIFYADLMEAAYGTLSEIEVKDTLWQKSYYWLHLLKKKGV